MKDGRKDKTYGGARLEYSLNEGDKFDNWPIDMGSTALSSPEEDERIIDDQPREV